MFLGLILPSTLSPTSLFPHHLLSRELFSATAGGTTVVVGSFSDVLFDSATLPSTFKALAVSSAELSVDSSTGTNLMVVQLAIPGTGRSHAVVDQNT